MIFGCQNEEEKEKKKKKKKKRFFTFLIFRTNKTESEKKMASFSLFDLFLLTDLPQTCSVKILNSKGINQSIFNIRKDQ